MKKLSFLLLLLSNVLNAQHQVGHTTIEFQDPNRSNRVIETEIYYPAITSGDDVSAVQEEFPVIVFGHGFIMSWDAYQNIWDALVPQGYILAFPRTEGSILATDHQEFGWDLQFLIEEIQNEGMNSSSVLSGVVASEMALMGHSMGGGASFLAADSLCTNGNINLKALIGLAPAESSTNGVSSINSAASVTVPTLIMSGSQDGVSPPADHHVPMYDALASDCKTFVNIIGGAHCYFANANLACDFGEGTSSTGISITRDDQHSVTIDFLSLWLEDKLKVNCEAFDVFNDSLNTSSRVTFNQVCSAPSPILSNEQRLVCYGDDVTFPDGVIATNTIGATSHVSNLLSIYGCDSIVTTNVDVVSIDVDVTVSGNTLSVGESNASYQWVDCDDNNQPINGEDQQVFSNASNGNYAVIVTKDGCSTLSSCYEVNMLGIDNLLQDDYGFYPNPTHGNVTVLFGEIKSRMVVDIYTVDGVLISSNEFINSDQGLMELNVPKGVYFIKLFDGSQVSRSMKLIKL